MLAQPVLAERMHDLAVVNALTEVGGTMDVARGYADRFAEGPRDAQAAIRKMVAAAYDATEAEQLDHERDAMGHATGAAEAASRSVGSGCRDAGSKCRSGRLSGYTTE